MSTQDLNSAALPADKPHSPTTAQIQEQKPDMDTEMTSPLTSMDHYSATTRSSSPAQIDEMSDFQSTRERNEEISQVRNGRSNSMARRPNNNQTQGQISIPRRHTQVHLSRPPASGYPSGHPSGQYDPNTPMMGPQGSRAPYFAGQSGVRLSAVRPGAVYPTPEQTSTAYAYGIRLADGSFTRLLRADEFPTANIPATQGPEGLIILPPPTQQAPGPDTPDRIVPYEVVQQLPPTEFNPQLSGHGLSPPSDDATQQQIDLITEQLSAPSARFLRRDKVYCDKWIHDGVCAFTQMGCRYKHEMPLDKVTQVSIGLNHGVPNWFRRLYGPFIRMENPQTLPSFNPLTNPRTEGPWRRIERIEGPPPQFGTQSNYGTHVPHGPPGPGSMRSRAHGESRSSFGPIGPPQMPNRLSNSNSYSALEVEEEAQDEDDDEMIYKGRRQQ